MPESFVVLLAAFRPHLSFLEIAAMFSPRLLWRAPEWWLRVLVALEATRDLRRRGPMKDADRLAGAAVRVAEATTAHPAPKLAAS